MPRNNSSRGKRAVRSGQYGEETLEGALLPYIPTLGFKEFEHQDLYPGPYPEDMSPVCIRQCPTRNPFNLTGDRNGAMDFMLYSLKTIHVQVKNQNLQSIIRRGGYETES